MLNWLPCDDETSECCGEHFGQAVTTSERREAVAHLIEKGLSTDRSYFIAPLSRVAYDFFNGSVHPVNNVAGSEDQ